jgi:hypothetical protein
MLKLDWRSALWIVVFPLSVFIGESQARAQSAGDIPEAAEPWFADEGDWAADFNEAQIQCYQGSMRACDSIWLNDRVLLDSPLGQYGRTCGGRVDAVEIRRANLTCTEAFPDNE